MRRFLVASLTLWALGLAPTPALAQRTTGTIIGTVTDESNAVLPGVTVTLKSSAVQGAPTTVTTETGVYRFPALSPGQYTLTFLLQGFATVSREQVTVGLGQDVQIDAKLNISTLAENVTVTGDAPVIDAATTQLTTNLTRQWVEAAPIARFTFFDLINQAAGVSQSTSTSSRSNSFGSSTNENSYQLDGNDLTAPQTGAAWPWPNTDAIEEVQVLSLGATAEYGNLLGAVFNIVTRQGGNAFHGDANYYYQNQGITGRNTTVQQECAGVVKCPSTGLPFNRSRYTDTTEQLGGPLMKDRLWFFGAFQFQEDDNSPAGTPAATPSFYRDIRLDTKLTAQFSASQKLMFSFHDDWAKIPGAATALVPVSTLTYEYGPVPSPGLNYTAVLSNKTFVEARYAGFYASDFNDPQVIGDPRTARHYLDLNTSQQSGGIFGWTAGKVWRTGVNGKLSHFSDDFIGGSHDLKLGIQYTTGGSDYAVGNNDAIYTYGTTPAYGFTQAPFHRGGTMTTVGTYVDDTFRPTARLTFNLGARFDYTKAFFEDRPTLDKNGDPAGGAVAGVDPLFSRRHVSPRIGATFKLNSSGTTVLKGYYGRLYGGIITGEFQSAQATITPLYRFSGSYDSSGNPIGLSKVSDNTNLKIDPNYDAAVTDQFIAGVDHQVTERLGLQVNYIYKRSQNFGAWTDISGSYVSSPYSDTTGADATGQALTLYKLASSATSRLFELSNDPRMFSRYHGLSIQLNKRLSNNWQGTFGVTLSRSTGRIGSSLAGPASAQASLATSSNSGGGLPGFGANPNDFVNTDGRLIGDRPVVAKAQFVYHLPYGLQLGANINHQTGRPWARQVRVGGLGFPTRPLVLAETVGDRRVGDVNLIDLRLEKNVALGKGSTLALFGDVLNVTNSDQSESVGSRDAGSVNFGLPTVFIAPRRLMIGSKIRF